MDAPWDEPGTKQRRRTLAELLKAPVEQRMAEEEATRGVRGLAPGQQPMMTIGEAASLFGGMVPGVGDAMSVYDTGKALAGGDYTGAALSAVGVLPFVPGLGGMIDDVARRQLQDRLTSETPGLRLWLSGGEKTPLTVNEIVVPKEARGQGVGSRVMEEITRVADETETPMALSPSADFGGSKGRLEEFYRRFGFVPNKGRNKDFTTRESMVRQPKKGDR